MPAPEANVVAEFATAMNDLIVMHGFVCIGLRNLTDLIGSFPVRPEDPDPDFYFAFGAYLPSEPQYAVWKKSVALEQIAQDGPVEARLSQQWVVYAYAVWEEDFRPRLAAARGCATKDVKFPLLGDLRHLRNDIVHHRGIATAANTGRCEVLKDWFQPGDRIHLSDAQFAELLMAIQLWSADVVR